ISTRRIEFSPCDVPLPAFLFLVLPPPPRSTLFPYTTLFRSSTPARTTTPWRSTSAWARRSDGRGRSHRDRAAPFAGAPGTALARSEEHTSELQSQSNLVCRLLLEKKKKISDISRTGFGVSRL